MKIRNGDELDLAGKQDETIRVEITRGKDDVVNNFILNGRPWDGPGVFQLDSGLAPIFKLLVQTIYKTKTGGSCEITVSGDQGGDVSVHDEFQAPGETFDAAMYTFIVQ